MAYEVLFWTLVLTVFTISWDVRIGTVFFCIPFVTLGTFALVACASTSLWWCLAQQHVAVYETCPKYSPLVSWTHNLVWACNACCHACDVTCAGHEMHARGHKATCQVR